MDTLSTTKTLAYLLVVALFPVLGIIFYYSFRIINRGLKKGQWLIAPTSYSAKKYA